MVNKISKLFSGLQFTIISIAFFVLNVVLNLLKIPSTSRYDWLCADIWKIYLDFFPTNLLCNLSIADPINFKRAYGMVSTKDNISSNK